MGFFDKLSRVVLRIKTNMYSPDEPRNWNPDDGTLRQVFGVPHEVAAALRSARLGFFPYVEIGWTRARWQHEAAQAASKEQRAKSVGKPIHTEGISMAAALAYLAEVGP